MPRITRPDWTPKYALHKSSGQARVRIPGRGEVWLPGPANSAQSRRAYDREIAAWIAAGRPGVHRPGAPTLSPLPVPPASAEAITVVEVVAPFIRHCETYYQPKPGGRASTLHKVRSAMALLIELHAETAAAEFGAQDLEALQGHMVRGGLARSTINGYTAIVRQFFKWAVRKQMVPPIVLHSLSAVDGLRRGRSEAREPEPIRPVAEATIAATSACAPPMIADMIRLQLLTGARPGELCGMTTRDIDTSGRVWIFTPRTHKNEHHGIDRHITIGPRAQAVLRKYLRTDLERPIFSPAEAEAARNAERRSPNGKPPPRRGRARRRPPGDRYDVNAYRRAIWRACDRAFPPGPPLALRDDESQAERRARLTSEDAAALNEWRRAHRWHPNQLRHSRATEIRRAFGIEAAGAVLGHARLSTTEVYAEKSMQLAERVAAEVG